MSAALPRIIALCGRKGSGKDTAAAVLMSRGYENVKFAGGLKTMLRSLMAYQGYSEDVIEEMIEGRLKEHTFESLCGHTPRHAMQTLGSQWGRDQMHEDFWVQTAVQRIASLDRVVVTDVRFPNEAEAIYSLGGVVIGITADWIVPQEMEHESEAKIDALIDALPASRRITNRRARPGEEQFAIQEFQSRFLSMLTTPA